MATSIKSPNPQFKTLELTAEAFTVIEKLENGIEDIPWAEAVIVDADTALPKDSVPTEKVFVMVLNAQQAHGNCIVQYQTKRVFHHSGWVFTQIVRSKRIKTM